MAFSIKPEGDFEYILDGEVLQAEIEEVGSPVKTADRRFKDDTETWAYKFAATLADGNVVTWDVNVEVGDTMFHDTSSNGVSGLPEGVEVERDPDFVCDPEDDDE
ncbi:hypothetical protein [Enterobacter cancerogenus]|uniref:hypothetical protein n=1 Tax=Enterobacter cancerogenus TaxID=69218 RepID=UPI0028B61A3F|nr:hypothetical protein [Enterobacter cancerogenus]MDT7011999.1 hypothetical protein [Enterobacter cancerogenus]WNN55087.1 hypothetical protein RIN64_12320 [Enterobacter cancerogenus]